MTRASPLVADLAGDAAPEVIATNLSEVFVWSGDGTLLPGFPASFGACRAGNRWLRAGDLDGDGKDEIICVGSGGLEAYRGDGSAVHGWHVGTDDPFRPNWPPAVADVVGDGDGLKEVVRVDPSLSEIFVWNVAGTPGPLLAEGPMYHHDAKHSNVLPVTLP